MSCGRRYPLPKVLLSYIARSTESEEVSSVKQYERPAILATYTVEELTEEAAVCVTYGGAYPPPNSN